MENDKYIMDKIHQQTDTVHRKIMDAFRYTAISLKSIRESQNTDFDISSLTKIVINLNDIDYHVHKNAFSRWVIGNCLSNMLECYKHYIENCLDSIDKHIPQQYKEKLNKKNLGIFDKTLILNAIITDIYQKNVPLIPINEDQISALKSIKFVRNCFVHENGFVNEKSIKKELFLKWYYFNKKIGKPTLIKKRLKVNRYLSISAREIYQIGIFIETIAFNITSNLRKIFQYDYPENIIII